MKIRANSVIKIDTGNVNMDYTFPKGASLIGVITNLSRLYSDVNENGFDDLNSMLQTLKNKSHE